MHSGSLYGRGRLMISKATDALRARDWSLNQIDPDGLRYLATITVWGHWILCAVGLIELVYRPYYGVAKFAAYTLLLLVLVVSNGYIHYRLRSNRAITWRWLQALYTIGVAVISVLVAISGGFSHPFLHEFYYPALAAFAVLLTSFRLTMAYRHAKASRVSVDLEFGAEDARLSISDNGIGLPDDYSERGNGFANMTATAERLDGRLAVEKRGAMGGATVTCVIPLERG